MPALALPIKEAIFAENQDFMLKTKLEKASYCLGVNIASSMKQQGINEVSAEAFIQGIKDMYSGSELKINSDEIGTIIQDFMEESKQALFQKNIDAGNSFLAKNKLRPEITTLASGLQYEVLAQGAGVSPSSSDTVTTHYHGTLIDGTVFDSSFERGEPVSFPVNGVIKGWVEALQLMKIGAKWRLYVPQDLAYGANPHPGGPIEPYSALIFDVELISIN